MSIGRNSNVVNELDPEAEQDPPRSEPSPRGAETPAEVDREAPTRATPVAAQPRVEPTGPPASEGRTAVTEELRDLEIGEYKVLRRLGAGGMAEVYLAHQASLDRQVALKVLRKEVLSDSNDVLLRRFEQEAKAAASLTHANIVQVYGVGEEDGLHYIAQEYVRGVNLKQYLRRQGPPNASTAIRVARQIAAALQAAAEAGIVHRDVKPENVMVTRKGRVKVADFGLAQLSRNEKEVQLTQVGMTMGTPLYMSPEQVNGKPVDGRSDLYSFGVTLYHLLAGEPPFRGETALAIAVKHLNDTPEPLDSHRPDLPDGLCDLVHRLMAKSPAERPPNAGVVVEELREIGKSLDGDESSTRSWSRVTSRRTSTDWPRRIATFGAAALLVLVVSAALGWWTRPGSPLDTPPAPQRIAKQKSSGDQVFTALRLGTAEGWQAVVDYFGDDPDAGRDVAAARLRLGLFALADRRVDDAEQLFDDVRTRYESDPELRTNAFAGLAAVESLRGDYSDSQKIVVAELEPNRDRMTPEMQRLVLETIRRNRNDPDTKVADGLEDVFRTYEPF